jgi:hypothetical protein
VGSGQSGGGGGSPGDLLIGGLITLTSLRLFSQRAGCRLPSRSLRRRR